MAEWGILLRLEDAVGDQRMNGDPAKLLDDFTIMELIKHETKNPDSPIYERDVLEIMTLLNERKGPERLLDFYLRVGPYGEHFGKKPGGLTLSVLEAHPHGLDLGPLQPRIPEILQTASGKIELASPLLTADVNRLRQTMRSNADTLLLVGRRDLRSNNSWMHNLPVLVKGEDRCSLWIHSMDAARLELFQGDKIWVQSRTGNIEASVKVTDDVMPGTVSLPHGWGHSLSGTRLHVSRQHAGINVNLITDDQVVDTISGNAVLNGVPVVIEKAK